MTHEEELALELDQIKRIKRWSRPEAERVFEIYASTGLSLLRFSRDYGIQYKRLRNWSRRLKQYHMRKNKSDQNKCWKIQSFSSH